MRHFLSVFLLGTIVLLTGACSRHKIIPDSELAQIFHDAFLTNAYIGNQGVKIDSLDIYEPIFARYGYTTTDVQYTIGNFSKRKSALLSDVVEQAIKLLDDEGLYYEREVSVLDTIDNVARRRFTRVVYADSLVRVRTLRDTSRLNIIIDSLQRGDYNVSMEYLVDSLDQNVGLTCATWLERRDSTRINNYSFIMRRERAEPFTRRFTTDSTSRRIVLDFAIFRNKPRRPSITLRNLKVEYIPETGIAVDSLYLQQLNIRIFADEFFRVAMPTDSL